MWPALYHENQMGIWRYFMNRNFIFGMYASVCVVGLAALLFASVETASISLLTAMMIVGFYGFFSTTCCFFLSARIKSEQEDFQQQAARDLDAVWRRFDDIENKFNDAEGEVLRIEREIYAQIAYEVNRSENNETVQYKTTKK